MYVCRLLFATCFVLACLQQALAGDAVSFKTRSWNTTKEIVEIISDTKSDGEYELISGCNSDWMQLGPSQQYYVVAGAASRKTLVIKGTVHLILCDGAHLTLTGGVKLEGDAILHIHGQSDDQKTMGQMTVTNSYSSTAGIGSARSTTMGKLFVHGGNLEVTGADYAAGIGGGEDIGSNEVTIYSGVVTANGGKYGAGIGGGYAGSQTGQVSIYGGNVTATGGKKAAGIGGGRHWRGGSNGGRVIIYHAEVTANGGDYGAGIGGGCGVSGYGKGGHVSIYSGTVKAYGGEDAAGIGGGESGDGGTVNIEGGLVTAEGKGYGAGIGGGEDGNAGYFDANAERYLNNGTPTLIKITAGSDCGNAVGAGKGGNNNGTIHAGNAVHVNFGNSQESLEATPALKALRERRTGERKAVRISPCSRGDDAAQYDYDIKETYHCRLCKYCNYSENKTHEGTPCVCGKTLTQCIISVYHRGINELTLKPEYTLLEQRTVAVGKTYTLPSVAEAIDGYRFAGWLANPDPQPTTIFTDGSETLEPLGSVYTAPAKSTVDIYARYQYDYKVDEWSWELDHSAAQVMLYCDAAPEADKTVLVNTTNITHTTQTATLSEEGYDLYEATAEYGGRSYTGIDYTPIFYSMELQNAADNATQLLTAEDVMVDATLKDRTFYHDGKWNTLCLPFDVMKWELSETTHPLYGATIFELDTENSAFDESTGKLTLIFKDPKAGEEDVVMQAGKPYLVKWAEGTNQSDPLFSSALIKTASATTITTTDGKLSFVPTFAPVLLAKNAKNILYLGSDNKLYYPAKDNFYINAFRAYFVVNIANAAREISSVEVDFGDGETTSVSEKLKVKSEKLASATAVYDLQGRKVSGTPTQKGIYIVNNRKIIIK